MKTLYSLFLLSVAFITGCCKKTSCDPVISEIYLKYHGYGKGNADALMVYNYMERTGFTEIVKTDILKSNDSTFSIPLQQNYEYIVQLKNDNNTDTIHRINWRESTCKSCSKKTIYYIASGFSINGQDIGGMEYNIHKQ